MRGMARVAVGEAMTLGWLIAGVSLAVIAAVVSLAVCAEWWPRLRRWFADPDEMPDEWKDEHQIGWREGDK